MSDRGAGLETTSNSTRAKKASLPTSAGAAHPSLAAEQYHHRSERQARESDGHELRSAGAIDVRCHPGLGSKR
jgi:hypothetical protein